MQCTVSELTKNGNNTKRVVQAKHENTDSVELQSFCRILCIQTNWIVLRICLDGIRVHRLELVALRCQKSPLTIPYVATMHDVDDDDESC